MAMRNREDDGMITKVVSINRVSKTVKGGRIMKFAALVVVGDGKGNIGYGVGKSGEVPEAIRKGEGAAKKNMRKVCLSTDGGIFSGYIDIYVHDKAILERMIRKLSSIDGIKSVVRTEI